MLSSEHTEHVLKLTRARADGIVVRWERGHVVAKGARGVDEAAEDGGWGVNLDGLQKAGDSGRQWEFTAGCIQSVYTRAGDARSNRK